MKNSASGPKNAVSAMPVLFRYASAFSATPRGSRSYGSRVIGSTIVQIKLSVGSALKTSIHAVAASGMTSMSEALMTFQPRMLDPSKPSPSVKISSLYSLSVVVKCCHVPGKSVNLKSTSLTSWSLIILETSEAVFLSLAIGMRLRVEVEKQRGRLDRPEKSPANVREHDQTAFSPISSVLIRTTCSTGSTKTLPSPILPVLAALTTTLTAFSTISSARTTSTLTLGKKSTVYSLPR